METAKTGPELGGGQNGKKMWKVPPKAILGAMFWPF